MLSAYFLTLTEMFLLSILNDILEILKYFDTTPLSSTISLYKAILSLLSKQLYDCGVAFEQSLTQYFVPPQPDLYLLLTHSIPTIHSKIGWQILSVRMPFSPTYFVSVVILTIFSVAICWPCRSTP